jgi:Tfp pilus assembly protein PilN
MIKINLIGDSYSRRLMRRRMLSFFLSVLLLVIGLSAAAGYWLHDAVEQLQKESAQKAELSQGVQEITKRATVLEQQRKRLEPRVNALASLQQSSGEAVEIFYAVSVSIPTAAWITELRLYEGAVEVAGIAPDDESISGFVNRLSEQAIFLEVTLARARPVTVPQERGKEYIIRAKIARDGATKGQSEKAGEAP